METRPELILLQKSMVIVEGVARSLDPSLNVWTAAEPIAREWIEANLGIAGRLRDAGEGASAIGRILADAPRVLAEAERASIALADAARQSRSEGARQQPQHRSEAPRLAIWIGALALAAIAAALWR
jgi:ubiquinone biosynthesis protein